MPKGEEVRSVSQQNVSPSAQGLEVKELSPSGRGRSVSLDIPLYRTRLVVPIPNRDAQPECPCHGDLSPTAGSGPTACSTGISGKRATQPERTKSLFRYSSKRGLQ